MTPEEKLKVFERIKTQRDTYVKLLKDLLGTCKNSYKVLDIYYDDLQIGNTLAQMSIILATSSLTFLQSYFGQNTLESDGSLSEDVSAGFLKTYTLCVSTGTSLTLAIMRFLKLDEKRENVHDLKVRFLDLHNRIRHQLDILRPWKDNNYFDSPDDDYFHNMWTQVWSELESEYKTIIDIKKILFVECNKLVYGETLTRYKKRIYLDLKNKKKYDEKFDNLQLEIKENKNIILQKEFKYEQKWEQMMKDHEGSSATEGEDSSATAGDPSSATADREGFADAETGSSRP